MTVSIVIAAHNGERTIADQLAAVERSAHGTAEIIVVDNASSDGTSAVARSFPDVRVLACSTPGRCAARNAGVRAANGDPILVCDQDDVVSDAWVDAMTSALNEYDVVGGPLEQDSLNDPFVRTTRINRFAAGLPTRDGVPQPTGANMGFRRAVFDTIGGFDERFLIGAEDNDFTYRAHGNGFSIGYAPGALVAYRLRSDRRGAARQSGEYVLAGAQFRAKHGIAQPWKSKVLRALYHVGRVARIWSCADRSGRYAYSQALAMAKAAWSGYRRYGIVG